MKIQILTAALIAGWTLCGAPVLDPGGVSIDFAALPPVSTGEQSGENLIQGGTFRDVKIAPNTWKLPAGSWGANYWVHIRKSDGDYQALLKQVAPFLKREIVTENGNPFARISSDIKAWEIKDAKKQDLSFSNQLIERVVLPENAAGKNYILNFRYRGKLGTLSDKNNFRVFIRFRDDADYDKGKDLKYEKVGYVKPGAAWDNGKVEFSVPAGAKLVNVMFLLYGPGEIDLDDLSLREAVSRGALSVDLFPQIKLDQLYRLGENVPNVLTFDVIDPGKTPRKNPKFEFVLPPGFEVSDCQLPLLEKKNSASGTHYSYSLDNWRFGKKYNTSYQINLMVRSTLPAGGKRYEASYRTINGDVPGAWSRFHFLIMPKLEAPQPKRFITGTELTQQHRLPLQQSKNDYANFYADCGFNWMASWFVSDPKAGQILKKRGVTRSAGIWPIANAYRFGLGPKPENALFRQADGTAFTEPGGQTYAICPTEMVERGPHFREVARELIEKPLLTDDTLDTFMVNHEPFYYNGKGCFCVRCRDMFRGYLASQGVKVEIEKFNRAWPGSAADHADHWTKFRSYQHGRAIVSLEKTIREIGKKAGKDSHYIPEVNWAEFEESSLPSFANYSAVDYMADLPWIEPWGPYIYHDLDENYLYTPGFHLTTWAAGKMVKDFLKKHIPDPKKIPKLIAFPHGIQSMSWVTEPEAVGFETLCYFLNGWEGSVLYRHNNMDYIYYAELAKANRLIALYEDFLFDGKERGTDTVETLTPIIGEAELRPWLNGDKLCAFLCFKQEKFAPFIGKENALRMKSFQLGDRRLVAAGNFWQRGENFFKLKLKDLNPAGRYVVRQPHAKRNFGVFTGKELENGVTLHAGALRWEFFVVEPAKDGADYGETVSPEFVAAEMKKRLPAIQTAYAKEREKAQKWEKLYAAELDEERAATEGPAFEFGVLPNVASGKVNLTPAGQGASAAVNVNAPGYSLKLHPAQGGVITDLLTPAGLRLDTPQKDFGIGMDTILSPVGNRLDLRRRMRVAEITPVKEGVLVVLERKLSPGDNRNLRGVVLTKRMLFRPDGFDLETIIRNHSGKELEIGYRQHNFAPVNRAVDGVSGTVTAGGKAFPRDMKHKLLRIGKAEPGLEKMLGMKPESISSGELVFSAPWSPVKITAAPLNPEKLYGILMWEGGNGTTAEYLYAPVTLRPGESLRSGSFWRIQNR